MIQPILKTPPTTLLGTQSDAFELLGKQLKFCTSVNELFKLEYFSIYAYSQTTKKLRQLQTMEKKLQHYVEVSQMV